MGSPLASQISEDKENSEETIALTGEAMEVETKEEEDASDKECKVLCWAPFLWFKMLADEMHWSFVLGVVVVNGVSQGLGDAVWGVASDYYWKDVQKVQPSAAQVYQGIASLPWMVKPLWGLLTDVLPVAGYRRRPYLIFAGLLGVISTLTLSLHNKLNVAFALLAMTAARAGVAISDVTTDACIAQNSISHPLLAADMQSLCGFSESIGRLLGFSISGILVDAIGSQGVLGLISIPSALVFLVGIVLKETRTVNFAYTEVGEKLLQASQSMWRTLKCPEVWRPCLYMYLSFALSISIYEGMFYWYTDRKSGLSFSEEGMGFIYSMGSVGSFLGYLLYQNILKDYSFHALLFWSQLLTSSAGMLDLILVFRLNLKLGIPDYFFAVIDRSVSQLIGSIKWTPLLVVSSKLCPPGIEGTFFALLMSIDNFGGLTSSWLGGLLLHMLKVTRTEFSNLWVAILIRNIMRLLPLTLLFLVPEIDLNSTILPAELLTVKDNVEALETQTCDIERVSLVGKSG